ncbi:MAG: adenylyl-sulfate kinase [Planctomycetaceae bacterium]|nr:adenylyl-sulfate kinase [Planctomycetaceae bacterium]|tara:strand:- start:1871 stop:2401 length:531 start_codon:yes stop_codon:yes gene_type:complete
MPPNHCKIIWLTGLSGAGKSTLAEKVSEFLNSKSVKSRIIDGDDVRKTMKVQKFTESEIVQNNLRVIQICRNLANEYEFLLVAVIAPFRKTRQKARETFGTNYTEVYVQASMETLMKRDTKGLYQKAFYGEIENLIGVDPKTPYEEPWSPELTIDTDKETAENSASKIINFIAKIM